MANNPINQENVEEGLPHVVQVKEVLFTEIIGKVKWFNVKRGYGFVCRIDTKEDVFIHQSAIVKSNPAHQRRSVGDGEDIMFDIVKGEKGNEAANVCGADGNHVRGSEYALRYQKGGRGRPRGRGRGRGMITRSRGPSEDMENHQEFIRVGPRGGRSYRGDGRGFRGVRRIFRGDGRSFRGDGRNFRGGDERSFRGGDERSFRGGDERSFRGGDERSFRGGDERSFRGGDERSFRGGDERSFRGGGRPYFVQYRKPYSDYEMPHPPSSYYDHGYFPVPDRGRGGRFRGPRIFRGSSSPRDMQMNFNPYEFDGGYERRPFRGGRGRFRNTRGRGFRDRGGAMDNVRVKDEGEEHQEENDSGEPH